jgi:hypothetical protein
MELQSEYNDLFRLPGRSGRLDRDSYDVLSTVNGFDYDAACSCVAIDHWLPAGWTCFLVTATLRERPLVFAANAHSSQLGYLLMGHLGKRLVRVVWCSCLAPVRRYYRPESTALA